MGLYELEERDPFANLSDVASALGIKSGENSGFAFRKKPVYSFFKRAFDIIVSALALIILSPLFLVIAVSVKLHDKGPLIYKHQRMGKDGRLFYVYKFRTMLVGADNLADNLTPEQLEAFKRDFKLEDDPRITRLGKFMRKSSLDELPQFFNSLIGDMSIVGPRPITKKEIKFFKPYEDVLLKVRPGITGYWQVNGRSNVTYDDFSRQKLELYYVTYRSVMLDLKIFIKTFKVFVDKTGAV